MPRIPLLALLLSSAPVLADGGDVARGRPLPYPRDGADLIAWLVLNPAH